MRTTPAIVPGQERQSPVGVAAILSLAFVDPEIVFPKNFRVDRNYIVQRPPLITVASPAPDSTRRLKVEMLQAYPGAD